jgi:hypothetical protein
MNCVCELLCLPENRTNFFLKKNTIKYNVYNFIFFTNKQTKPSPSQTSLYNSKCRTKLFTFYNDLLHFALEFIFTYTYYDNNMYM